MLTKIHQISYPKSAPHSPQRPSTTKITHSNNRPLSISSKANQAKRASMISISRQIKQFLLQNYPSQDAQDKKKLYYASHLRERQMNRLQEVYASQKVEIRKKISDCKQRLLFTEKIQWSRQKAIKNDKIDRDNRIKSIVLKRNREQNYKKLTLRCQFSKPKLLNQKA